MRLKHISLLIATFLIAVAACSGTESAISAHRTSAGPFSAVRTTGSMPVELRQNADSAGLVIIEASDRAIAQVKITNAAGTLVIEYDSRNGLANYSREVKRITAYCGREMRQLILTGSGMLKTRNLHTPTELTAVLTGSGMLTLDNVDCLNFTGSLTGSGMLDIDGIKARNISTSGTGSGALDIDGINATSFNCTVSGSGMASVNGHAAKASLALRGSGLVNASGLNSRSVSVSATGSGAVKYNTNASDVKIISGRDHGNGNVTR